MDNKVLEYDKELQMPIDNNFGYIMGAMSIIFDKKTGLSKYLHDDIIDVVVDYIFHQCWLCNGPVVIQSTVCSKLCVLSYIMKEEYEDVE